MPISRRKIGSVVKDFTEEIKRLERFDADNQKKHFATSANLTKVQLHFLTEAIFFRAFRTYERIIRDIFLLYCLEKRPLSDTKVVSYLKPKNFLHAEELLKSSMRFLDWADPDNVIDRAETYLIEGFPIKLPLSTNRIDLHDFRKIRNHIAHDSNESLNGYKDELRKYFGTIPLLLPAPGEYLLLPERNDTSKYKLIAFFELLKTLIIDLT